MHSVLLGATQPCGKLGVTCDFLECKGSVPLVACLCSSARAGGRIQYIPGSGPGGCIHVPYLKVGKEA